jgi:hypothetical protein
MALYFDILLFSHNLAKDRIYADKWLKQLNFVL